MTLSPFPTFLFFRAKEPLCLTPRSFLAHQSATVPDTVVFQKNCCISLHSLVQSLHTPTAMAFWSSGLSTKRTTVPDTRVFRSAPTTVDHTGPPLPSQKNHCTWHRGLFHPGLFRLSSRPLYLTPWSFFSLIAINIYCFQTIIPINTIP